VLPYVARGAGLAAICALAVLAGEEAVSGITFPGVGLLSGGACAAVAMLIAIVARPQWLGREAQIALSRLLPAFALRFAPAVPAKAEGAPQ
jgi:hypothetical protein